MTIQQIRDSFVVKYKLECLKRGVPEKELGDTLIAQLLSEAQQDISRRHAVIEASGTVSVTSGTYSYDLATNFGQMNLVTLDGSPITRVDVTDLQSIAGDTTNKPSQYAVKIIDDQPQIMVNGSQACTLTYYYNIDTNPATISSLTGNLSLPNRYANAVQYFLLAQIFDDITVKYEAELRSLRESQYSNKRTLKYSMGGI